jgi:hypothetical protein
MTIGRQSALWTSSGVSMAADTEPSITSAGSDLRPYRGRPRRGGRLKQVIETTTVDRPHPWNKTGLRIAMCLRAAGIARSN